MGVHTKHDKKARGRYKQPCATQNTTTHGQKSVRPKQTQNWMLTQQDRVYENEQMTDRIRIWQNPDRCAWSNMESQRAHWKFLSINIPSLFVLNTAFNAGSEATSAFSTLRIFGHSNWIFSNQFLPSRAGLSPLTMANGSVTFCFSYFTGTSMDPSNRILSPEYVVSCMLIWLKGMWDRNSLYDSSDISDTAAPVSSCMSSCMSMHFPSKFKFTTFPFFPFEVVYTVYTPNNSDSSSFLSLEHSASTYCVCPAVLVLV